MRWYAGTPGRTFWDMQTPRQEWGGCSAIDEDTDLRPQKASQGMVLAGAFRVDSTTKSYIAAIGAAEGAENDSAGIRTENFSGNFEGVIGCRNTAIDGGMDQKFANLFARDAIIERGGQMQTKFFFAI